MWRLDHHKNLFGTNKATPFIKGEGDWNLSNRIGNNTNNFMGSNMPCAGSSTFNDPNAYKNQHMTSEQRAKGIHTSDGDMIKMFRDKLASRGARGIFGMKRVFKIMDDNNNGTLEVQEFWKAVKDFRINLNQDEARHLFDLFDRNGDGTVDYDEILRAVAGDMNKFRVALVRKAFQILDKNGNGVVELDDIKGVYNGKQHPDVKAGKKTEDEVLSEFIDTFEMHHSMANPNMKDRRIEWEEFIEYYNNVSCSIDNDQYFELMMTNAWNLNNVTYKKGWGGEI